MCCCPAVLMSLLLVSLCAAKFLPKEKGCGKPDMPLHSTYLCPSGLCQESLDPGTFKAGAMLEYYCQPGYILASLPGVAICRRGAWHRVQDIFCKPQETSVAPQGPLLTLLSSIPLVAGGLGLLSCLMLCCLVLRTPAPSLCRSTSQAYDALEEPDVFVVEGVDEPGANCTDVPLPLPSYEEVVYGHRGASVLPACRGLVPLLLLAQSGLSGARHEPGGSLGVHDPPPSYQEAMEAAFTGAQDAPERELGAKWPALSSLPLER